MQEWETDNRPAWIDLADDENQAIWRRVFTDLGLQQSQRPTFIEPLDSTTWELRDVPETPRRTLDQDELLVAAELRLALEGVVGTEHWVYALDWQHRGYRFVPALAKNPASIDSWPVPAIPNGDYCLFVAQDLRFGWLGHPWEPTICVYGDLLAPMKPVLERMGWPIIRTGRKRRRVR